MDAFLHGARAWIIGFLVRPALTRIFALLFAVSVTLIMNRIWESFVDNAKRFFLFLWAYKRYFFSLLLVVLLYNGAYAFLFSYPKFVDQLSTAGFVALRQLAQWVADVSRKLDPEPAPECQRLEDPIDDYWAIPETGQRFYTKEELGDCPCPKNGYCPSQM